MDKKNINSDDRVIDDKIILHDKNLPGPYVLKRVEIVTPTGKRIYKIWKTRKNGYLFN